MKRKIKLSEWAKRSGVSHITAWRRAKAGEIVNASIAPSGRWVVEVEDEAKPEIVVAYVRVSSHDQKADLDRQVARIAEWASASGVKIDRYVREIGSGLNDRRRELESLIEDPDVTTIVVEHRDRLARFGVETLMKALRAQKRSIIVIDKAEVDNDLVQDMIDLMTCFSARLYGRRSARNRAQRAIDSLKP